MSELNATSTLVDCDVHSQKVPCPIWAAFGLAVAAFNRAAGEATTSWMDAIVSRRPLVLWSPNDRVAWHNTSSAHLVGDDRAGGGSTGLTGGPSSLWRRDSR